MNWWVDVKMYCDPRDVSGQIMISVTISFGMWLSRASPYTVNTFVFHPCVPTIQYVLRGAAVRFVSSTELFLAVISVLCRWSTRHYYSSPHIHRIHVARHLGLATELLISVIWSGKGLNASADMIWVVWTTMLRRKERYLQSKYFNRDETCWANGYGCCMVIGGSAFLFIPIANSFFRTFHLYVSPCVLVDTICNSTGLLPVSCMIFCNRRSGSNFRKLLLCAGSRMQCVTWQLGERKILSDARQVNECVVERREFVCDMDVLLPPPPTDSIKKVLRCYFHVHNVPWLKKVGHWVLPSGNVIHVTTICTSLPATSPFNSFASLYMEIQHPLFH